MCFFFFSSRRRHTIFDCDWSSDVCSSDLMQFRKIDSWFASSAGSRIHQRKVISGCGIAATSFQDEEIQKRSYPNSFGGQHSLEGYELVESLDLMRNARSEEHTSELQSQSNLVCRLLLEKKKKQTHTHIQVKKHLYEAQSLTTTRRTHTTRTSSPAPLTTQRH